MIDVPEMTGRIDVLDHGFVRLIDHMGSDLSVVRSARVSFDAEWRTGARESDDTRLVNYLWNHKHTTPFEACTLTFEVKAPIFVLRQWHRHRTQSYNELSARYKELPEEFYVPALDQIGSQSKDNKQGRTVIEGVEYSREEQVRAYRLCNESAFLLYKNLLEAGWPRELARGVLPVSTYSHMFVTMNLLNFFKFCELRLDLHAQYEIRVYAEAMMELIKPIFPVSVRAFEGGLSSLLK